MFAQRLKELRKKSGLTQKDFAEQFHISGGTIAMWETSKREPDFTTAVRIADFFGVSLDYLLGRHTDETQQKQKNARPELGGGQDESINSLLQELREGMQGLPEEQVEFFASLLRAMISQLSRTPGNSSADPEASEETVPQLEHANPM